MIAIVPSSQACHLSRCLKFWLRSADQQENASLKQKISQINSENPARVTIPQQDSHLMFDFQYT